MGVHVLVPLVVVGLDVVEVFESFFELFYLEEVCDFGLEVVLLGGVDGVFVVCEVCFEFGVDLFGLFGFFWFGDVLV